LKHLAPEISYRSLVALGIACVNGTPVSSFDRQDADRLIFFCSNQCKDQAIQNAPCAHLSRWSASLTKDRFTGSLESKQISFDANGVREDNKHLTEGSSLSSLEPRLKPATMRPLPHSPKQQMHLFMGLSQSTIHDASQVKPSLPAPPPVKHSVLPVVPATQRKSSYGLPRVKPSVPLNPLPMKKHGCDRSPIRICSEVRFLGDPFFLLFCYVFLAISHLILWYLLQEDFLKDVMQFLLQRGHTRLVPQGGLAEFPDAVLNTKRLDLYNLYKEVIEHFCCSLVSAMCCQKIIFLY
jgi:hypothetical protein